MTLGLSPLGRDPLGAAAPVAGPTGTGTVAGTGTVTSAGTVGKVATAALAAVATFTAVGAVGTVGSGTVDGTGTITASGDVLAANEGTGTLDGTGTIAGAGVVGASGSGTLDGTGTVATVGALGYTGSGSLSGTGTIAAAGAKGYTGTASLSGTGTITSVGEVSEPGGSGATVIGTVTFTAEGVVVSYDTDTSNRDDGVEIGDGYATVEFDPGVTPIPAHLSPAQSRIVARIIDTPPAWGGTHYNLADARTESIAAPLDRVLIDNVDWTYFRGAPAVVEGFKLIDPLLYGSATVTLPGVNPQFPDPDLGDAADLRELFRFARVRIQRVGDDDPTTDYKGFVSRVDTDGTSLRLEIGGQAAGSLSQMYVPPAVYRRKQDVETILVDTLRDARVQVHAHAGSSGIGLIRRGGSDGLSIFNETLAVWAGASGQAITFTPNADGEYRKTQKPGDDDPVDATAFIDESLVTQSLSQDFMEQYTRVYAHGSTLTGEQVSNVKTPGLTQGEAPEFELSWELGDTGDVVQVIQQQLAIHNFFDLEDAEAGLFNEATERAVMMLQVVAGLEVTGVVDEDTWNALWNLTDLGYSLDDAREYPMAQDIRTQKWLRTANGSKLALNPDYDPHLIPNDLFIDVGGPFSRKDITQFAESKRVGEAGVWTGTLTFRSGLWWGDISPGDDVSTADVMDRRDLLPNMRVKLPYFAGGIVVYLAGVDHGPDETQCLVSTVPQTTMEVWQAIQRRKEAKSIPGRAWSGHTRASQIRNDGPKEWDTSSGLLAQAFRLDSGWSEVVIPAGQAGIVQRIKIALRNAEEFACVLTQAPMLMPEYSIDANDPLARPLHDFRPDQRPWWETRKADFDRAGILGAWGTWDQPCGYGDSLKNDDHGPTAQPITGVFYEEAGFNYETREYPVLYLYVWQTDDENYIEAGRILRNQRTTDF